MTLTPSDYVNFLRTEYLADFVKSGGSAVKFAVPADDVELGHIAQGRSASGGLRRCVCRCRRFGRT